MKRFVFTIPIILFGTLWCYGQTMDQAKTTAEAVTRAAAGYPDSKPLRLHRREDLEDDLFRFQPKPVGRIQKAAYFFEVSTEGYFVLSPNEAVYVDSADGHVVCIVAVSTNTGQAYRLAGFDKPTSEFNRLASDASVVLKTTNDAELYARFFFQATSDPRGERLISSSRGLRHKVEDYFFFNYADMRAAQLFRAWWSGFSRAGLRVPFVIVASSNNRGYTATVPAISGAARVPQFDQWTLNISSTGICTVQRIRMVYRGPLSAGDRTAAP